MSIAHSWLPLIDNNNYYDDMLYVYQEQYDYYVEMDQIHPEQPHYLDDGDIFKLERAANLTALQNISGQYDYIYLALHGSYNPTTDTQYWSIGNQQFTDVSGLTSNISDWWGCYMGIPMTATDIMNKFQTATGNYLKE